ncbi:MAG: major capsid protein [Alphaproteobacteria bacterium]
MHMDIFRSSAFSLVAMTTALENVPFVPQRLGELGIFGSKPITTEAFSVEMRDDVISLIQTTPRGTPGEQLDRQRANIRSLSTRRLKKGDVIQAAEVQNMRAFGTETELQTVQGEVAQRIIRLRRDLDLTHEYHRLGAVQGLLLDADGSTIYNFFTEFGVSQAAEVDFDLYNAAPVMGDIRRKCDAIVRAMQRAAKGAWTPGTRVHALVGDDFWDAFVNHAEVRQTYLNWEAAAALREGTAWAQFQFGGITWENYRGTDDGSTVAIGASKAKFFPVGAPEVFEVVWSPYEGSSAANTPGKPFYPLVLPDYTGRDQYVEIELYSYPLFYCRRPAMLQRATAGTPPSS